MSGAACAAVIIETNRLKAEAEAAEKLFRMEMARELTVPEGDREVLLNALRYSIERLQEAVASAYANVGPPHDRPA
jgi:hypothetical protein